MRFSTGCKSWGLFVSPVNPIDITTLAQRVSYAVKAITYNAIDSADAY
jgi:hypothetical protein